MKKQVDIYTKTKWHSGKQGPFVQHVIKSVHFFLFIVYYYIVQNEVKVIFLFHPHRNRNYNASFPDIHQK